jgi:lipoprotein-anchoring transpeptidase ErfK/SrfK
MHSNKIIIALSAALLMTLIAVEGIGYYVGTRGAIAGNTGTAAGKSLGQLRAKNTALKHSLKSLGPAGVFIVVDTANNLLFLKDGEKILRKAVISSGSGNILRDPDGKKKWVFDTPRGEFSVLRKFVDPVWTKPDWAFIEDGKNVPRSWKDRMEEGVLGDYALGFGNGYFIHGTLYTRLLGRNVTHGCVRMGDKDLKAVFAAAPVGTRIFIF